MPNTLFKGFSSLSAAQGAVNRLLAAGIPAACMKIDSRADEAGGTEGNFAVGNQETGHTPFHDSTITIDDRVYEKDFASVKWRGTILLSVEPNDTEQEAKAVAILNGAPNARPG